MVLYCWVCKQSHCSNNQNLSFHRFPADSHEKAVWLEKLGLKQFTETVPKYARICSTHFEGDAFEIKPSGKIFLKKGACPLFFNEKYILTTETASTSRLDHTKRKSSTDTATGSDGSEIIDSFGPPLKRFHTDSSATMTASEIDANPKGEHEKNSESLSETLTASETVSIHMLITEKESDRPTNSEKEKVSRRFHTDSSATMTASEIDTSPKGEHEKDYESLSGTLTASETELIHMLINEEETDRPTNSQKKKAIIDLSTSDFSTPRKARKNFRRMKKTVLGQKTKIKTLQQSVRRLKSKVTNLNSLINHLKGKSLVHEDCETSLRPTEFCATWTSCRSEKKAEILSNQLYKHLKSHDVMGIDHLYENFYRQFKGAILNEEDGFNMQLQVSAFLNSMFKQAVQKFLVLVLCPEELILNWHYHLTIHGELQVHIVTPKTCPEDFDQEHGLVLLLSFTNIKLADALIEYGYFSVVVDHIDEVATKLIIRKLHGEFNIGLTRRNFFVSPHQKLQWTMLNWSNPGSVGKLHEFYQNDNDNFANTRDNYYHWWFTLTWKFCENFQRPMEDEIEDYSEMLSKWAIDNDILKTKKCLIKRDNINKPGYKAEKNVKEFSKSIEHIDENEDDICVDTRKNLLKKEVENSYSSSSSSDTIVYEPSYIELEEKNNSVKSIEEDDDIIMSIIGDTDQFTRVEDEDPEIKVSQKKEELMTEIFDDFSSVTENVIQSEDNDSTDFLLSLL